MTTYSATKARTNLFSLLKRATRDHEVLRIHYRDRGAVLLPEAEFESLLETVSLLSEPGFRTALRKAEDDVRSGRVFSIKEVFGKESKKRVYVSHSPGRRSRK